MEQRTNYLALILLDALEDENESDIATILKGNKHVNPSYVPRERGISPLHYVCGMENVELATQVAKTFLELGANPNVRSEENMTPLHVASIYGRLEIIKLLLKFGGDLEVYDDDERTPVLYAIEECHFEVVKLFRHHIFLKKCEKKKKRHQEQQNTFKRSLLESSLLRAQEESIIIQGTDATSPPLVSTPKNSTKQSMADHQNNFATPNSQQSTPNRLYYNYDVTSPYYINITHRRHKPQPSFPPQPEIRENGKQSTTKDTVERDNRQKYEQSPTKQTDQELEVINIDKSSIIESPVKCVNIFTLNRENLIELSKNCRSERSRISMIEMWREKVQKSREMKSIQKEEDSLESSFETAKDLPPQSSENAPKETISKDKQYFMQMTEAYVHTDDENGLVFYETKLLTQPRNSLQKESDEKKVLTRKEQSLNYSESSHSTNLTLPLDYETDALRKELTRLGEPPGPITKTTKRLYIKKLIKYQRKLNIIQELQEKSDEQLSKFSIELQRTLKSNEQFDKIQEFGRLEAAALEYFANNQHQKPMREGHLKQSFIYMLIDPRISCNLPGESMFLDKYEIWRRFLPSIFYVGKGKTSRPYSHLYEAMKSHSRLRRSALNRSAEKAAKGVGEMLKSRDDQRQLSSKKSFKKRQFTITGKFSTHSSSPVSKENKKLSRILDIWSDGSGVVCLHVFHNIMPSEAYTREAAIIDALSLQHLTNCKRGDYYGPSKTWTMKEKKYLGIALLYKSMLIYLAEGESQLSPSDLI